METTTPHPPINKVSHTVSELLALIDGDDTLNEERAWLCRNTFAAAECTVIRQSLVDQLMLTGKVGSLVHIQTYTIPETSQRVHTLWTPITWTESSEKRRLSAWDNSAWRREQQIKHSCLSLADEFVDTLAARFGLTPDQRGVYAGQIKSIAEGLTFDAVKFQAALDELRKKFNLMKG